jgi:hypothetical protein
MRLSRDGQPVRVLSVAKPDAAGRATEAGTAKSETPPAAAPKPAGDKQANNT